MLLEWHMKIALKFLWSLVLVPLFIFIKGDLSTKIFAEINELPAPISEVKKTVTRVAEKDRMIQFIVPVKPISANKNFNAHGMKVQLFDSEYNLLASSQVLNGQVTFSINEDYSLITNLHVVALETSEEVIIANPKQIEVSLEINEAHLNDE